MNVHSHYENLKVSRDAPTEVIKAAYKALSMLWHPDRSSHPRAPEIMRTINVAYDTLSDPVKRHEHDEWLAAQEMLWTFQHPSIIYQAGEREAPKPAARETPAEVPQKRGRAFEIDESLFAHTAATKRERLPTHTRVAIGLCVFFGLAGAVGAMQMIFHG